MEPDTQPTLTVSPTGTPVLPSWVPKLAAAVVAIAVAVEPLLPAHPTVAATIIHYVIGLGAVLGITSQGVRKADG